MRSMPHEPGGEKHRATVRASFDKQAVEFSESPVMTDAAALARLVAWAGVAGSERVLDVACGPGLVAAAFTPHAASVVGVDLTPAMLARGRAIVGERGIRNVAFVMADVERLPFPDQSFERVVSRRAFHHFPDPAPVLTEMARVCAAGGAIVIEDQAPPADATAADAMTAIDRLRDPSHTRAVDPGAWTALCAANGLALERVWLSSLELGASVRFRLELGAGEPTIEGRARVVRAGDGDERGVVFEQISSANRQRLIRFIFDRQRAALAKTRGRRR